MRETRNKKSSCGIHCEEGKKKSHHSEKLKKELISRLNRIEGQLRGVRRMIENDTYCDDVLNVIASIQAALHGTALLLLENHMKSCVTEQIQDGDLKVIEELMKTLRRMYK